MAQNLYTISQEAFALQLGVMSNGALKRLAADLYKEISFKSDKIPWVNILDLERKQTKIWAEMQRRGFIKKKDTADFHAWLFSQHKRMYY